MLPNSLEDLPRMQCIRKVAATIGLMLALYGLRSHAMSYEVGMDFEIHLPRAMAVQGVQAEGATNWIFSTVDPVYTVIPLDDMMFPVQVHTIEYVLTNPKKGIFKFRDGKVGSATRIPVDVIETPNLVVRSIRPTLFVSIPGARFETGNFNGHGTFPWQGSLDAALSTWTNHSQYKHFTVDWESTLPMQRQVNDVSDLVKSFLSEKSYAWDVVLIGHSRGGVFAHELGQRLSGHSKISKLHLILLDPTAASSFGDTYPTQLPAGAFGYLKYDSYPFTDVVALGTRSDENITGYTNYGTHNFLTQYRNPPNSHGNYAGDWLADTGSTGFAAAMQRILNAKDNGSGSFAVDEPNGKDLVQVRIRGIGTGAELDAECSDTSCILDGELTLGPLASVVLSGTVGIDGIDLAVASTFASASVVMREDQIAATQTTLFAEQSLRVNASELTVQHNVVNGISSVQTELGILSADVVVGIGGINFPVVSVSPLDAIVPGASLIKKVWKKFKSPF